MIQVFMYFFFYVKHIIDVLNILLLINAYLKNVNEINAYINFLWVYLSAYLRLSYRIFAIFAFFFY